MRSEGEAMDATAAASESDAEAGGAVEPIGVPPFQPLRAVAALLMTAGGFGIYEWVLLHFWSSESLGIHDRVPWPAYVAIAAAVVVMLAAIRTAMGIRSPHAKLGFSLLAFLAGAAVGIGGGRFAGYTLRGTLNPPFKLTIARVDRFPSFALPDQTGKIRDWPATADGRATLICVYRGDFCPFSRHEIADLGAIRKELRQDGAGVIAISTDPVERSRMLSGWLHTDVPLLSDEHETLLGPLGLVQHHRNGEPDNAIPAWFVVDASGRVRWLFTSRYYRELPTSAALIAAVRSVTNSGAPRSP